MKDKSERDSRALQIGQIFSVVVAMSGWLCTQLATGSSLRETEELGNGRHCSQSRVSRVTWRPRSRRRRSTYHARYIRVCPTDF